jgi:GT2 family glycosyltransferase/glycosyltransferase involved in cell wall biosynthesis
MPQVGLRRLPDWLVIAQESWDRVERRNQLLIRALAQRNQHSRFLFVERPLRPRELRSWRWPTPRQLTSNIWAVQVVRPLPDRVARRLSDQIECVQVRRAARLVGLDRPLLWTQDPRAASLVDRLPIAGVVYDLTDDWAAFEADPGRRAGVRDQIESLGRRADLVVACSRSLANDAQGWGAQPILLPNAVDPPQPRRPVPDELARLPLPRLGYAGTLHSARLDVGLVADAARLRPEWSFVFLGPDLLERSDRRRLFERENVHHLGVRAHSEVRSYLAGLDVGLLPNLVTDFTRSLDPLKTYEYMAAGLPVIATPAGIPAELAPHVDLVTTAEELVERAEIAMRDNNTTQAQARRVAVAHETWEARAAEIEQSLGVRSPEPGTSEVSVVIVSFNTRDLLERCLTDLGAQAGVALQTIVVDNASSDGSRDLVRERFPAVELIELHENVGFARANNLAFERCRGEYVLLLNSDAFVHPGALSGLVAAAQRHPRAAAIGARLLNADGTLQRSAWPFPDPVRLLLEAFGLHRILRRSRFYEDLGTWLHDEERSVDFVIGACLLLRADALREVAGFDERFWIYGEEADLQRRLAGRGWSVMFAPTAQAIHIGGASEMASTLRLRHFYAGQRRFLRKHRGLVAWPIARFALLTGSCLRGRWRAAWVAVRLR